MLTLILSAINFGVFFYLKANNEIVVEARVETLHALDSCLVLVIEFGVSEVKYAKQPQVFV